MAPVNGLYVIFVQRFSAFEVFSLIAGMQKIQHFSTLADEPWGRQDGCLPKLFLEKSTSGDQGRTTAVYKPNTAFRSCEPELQMNEKKNW